MTRAFIGIPTIAVKVAEKPMGLWPPPSRPAPTHSNDIYSIYSERILGLRPANERRRYKVTPSLIGWAQT